MLKGSTDLNRLKQKGENVKKQNRAQKTCVTNSKGRIYVTGVQNEEEQMGRSNTGGPKGHNFPQTQKRYQPPGLRS